jgi:hypothetical protein
MGDIADGIATGFDIDRGGTAKAVTSDLITAAERLLEVTKTYMLIDRPNGALTIAWKNLFSEVGTVHKQSTAESENLGPIRFPFCACDVGSEYYRFTSEQSHAVLDLFERLAHARLDNSPEQDLRFLAALRKEAQGLKAEVTLFSREVKP